MYSCPACGLEEVLGLARCRCGADLSLLQQLASLGDVWFNRALAALEGKKPGQALEWLAAACAVRPTDVAARRALVRVWAHLGKLEEARDALARAAELDPDAPETAALRAALDPPPPRKTRVREKSGNANGTTRRAARRKRARRK